jgi:hypothetical protein
MLAQVFFGSQAVLSRPASNSRSAIWASKPKRPQSVLASRSSSARATLSAQARAFTADQDRTVAFSSPMSEVMAPLPAGVARSCSCRAACGSPVGSTIEASRHSRFGVNPSPRARRGTLPRGLPRFRQRRSHPDGLASGRQRDSPWEGHDQTVARSPALANIRTCRSWRTARPDDPMPMSGCLVTG